MARRGRRTLASLRLRELSTDPAAPAVPAPGPFDVASFRRALAAHTADAVRALRRRVGTETLYAFALFTSGESGFAFVQASANTEEGLARRAAQRAEVDPRFRGFGRVPTDAEGAFRVATVKPGRVPGPGGRLQAPHLVCAVFMRGLLKHLLTRVYFPDEAANADDPVLALVEPARRGTLVARRGPVAGAFAWDVVLQGEGETVFFAW